MAAQLNFARDSMGCTWNDLHGREPDEIMADKVAEIMADPERLAEIDLSESEKFDGEVCEMFTLLADASDSGLVKRMAEGWAVSQMNARQIDVFARFARLADRMSDVRRTAVKAAAESECGA